MRSLHKLLAGLAVSFSLLCLTAAQAAISAAEGRPQDATQGSLWLRAEQNERYQPAPTLDVAWGLRPLSMRER